ncbi:unnamed protein product [Aphanomyces euteiches]
MFSFGVILSELDTEIVPYSDLRNGAGKPYQDTALLAKVMAGELLPSFSPDCETWFVHLARDCLALDPLDPLDRPTAIGAIMFSLLSREDHVVLVNELGKNWVISNPSHAY